MTDEYLAEHPLAALDRTAAVAASRHGQGELHFILHSAFCASTLLCRALSHPGMAMGLSEPTIFNDIVGIRRRGESSPAQIARLLDDAMALTARAWPGDRTVIVKPSNILNPMADALLALRSQSRAVLLYAPLPTFLASVARKGMWCRLWARELIEGYLIDGVADLGFTPQELFRQTDLQIAAIGWLAQHRLFHRLIDKYGAGRVLPLSSETLLAAPDMAVPTIGRHFGFDLSDADVQSIAASPAFRRHSKFGHDFDAGARAAEQAAAQAAHADELEKVGAWAAAVAEANGIPLTLAADA